MKITIIVLLIAFTTLSYCQKTKHKVYKINKTDFEASINGLTVKDKSFKFKAGDGKPVDVVTFISTTKAEFAIITLEKLNAMLDISNSKTTYVVKNKNTYKPRKIAAVFSPKDNIWMVTVEYTSQDKLGAIIDSKSFLSFDKEGEYLKNF
jgi:hypothetical protein